MMMIYGKKIYLKEAKKILKDKKVDIILSKIYTNKDKKLKLFKDPNNVNLQSLLIGNSGCNRFKYYN